MIYEDDILADVLTCPKCKRKYEDPRILPCGETLCNRCIVLQYDEKNNGINCDNCMLFHQPVPPLVAFPINKRILKLLEQEESRNQGSSFVSQFKKLLNDIRELSENLEANKNNSTEIVRDYCSKMKSEIQLIANNIIAEIQNQKLGLIAEINVYEGNCLKNIQKISPNLSPILNSLILDSHRFYSKWIEYLKFQVVKESDLTSATEVGFGLLRRLNKEEKILKKAQLNEQMATFKLSKINKNIIGKICYEGVTDTINMDNFYKIDLKYKLNTIDKAYFESININCFDNGDFLFSFPLSPFNIKLILLRNDCLLKQYEIAQPISKFKRTIYGDKIFLFFSFKQKLRILNKNFSILDETYVDHEIISLGATKDLLYCLTDENIILKYDHKLKLTQRIKVNPESLGGIIEQKSKLFELRIYKQNLYLSSMKRILVINLTNLIEFKQIQINEKKFIFFDDKIVALNSDHLIFYDLNGNLLQKQQLSSNFSKNLILVESENGDKLSLFDFFTYILYSYGF